jgi:hypothetical protein
LQLVKCPIDNSELTISDRQGVEIDFCPQCRGVWLDRGELDKIIERTSGFDGGGRGRGRDRDRDDDDDDNGGGIRGLLGNLFDF